MRDVEIINQIIVVLQISANADDLSSTIYYFRRLNLLQFTMGFFNKLFGSAYQPIKTYNDFWVWFSKHEQQFFNAVKKGTNIENDFFKELSPKLNELKDSLYFLTGMNSDSKAELILTPDGDVKNIVFVEELVAAAPILSRWKFTALKPELNINDVNIDMAGLKFSADNIHFTGLSNPFKPDDIHIKITHDELNDGNKDAIGNGIYIFLDNFLGEMKFATTIDNLSIVKSSEIEDDLIPVEKLKSYLEWREKEFVEKYEGIRIADNMIDSYTAFEFEGQQGPFVAVINQSLLQCDAKPSHPWMLTIAINYDGKNTNGLPDKPTYKQLDLIENEITEQLPDHDGYLNLGRETGENTREIYFACKDFRKPSKVLYQLQQKYNGTIKIDYNIYKDKYWSSLDRYLPQ